MTIKPWWEAIALRDEVASGGGQIDDVQMSLFNAIKGTVPYADASYYGDITHPTADLVDLMGKVAVRLGVNGKGSEQAKAVWRLDQGMGGGKSHGLVGMWHLATHTSDFIATEIGQRTISSARTLAGTWTVTEDLQNPLCVVLSCDNMTPGQADVALDGPAVTLGERCLWRLVERDGSRYEKYREKINSTNKERIQAAIESSGRPVLILIDEVMDYLRVVAATHDALLAKDMAFLRGLLDCANEAKNCVVVMVMISSENDTMQLGSEAQNAREELNGLLIRNGRTAAVTGGGDFADIIRRRLFADAPDQHVVSETATDFLGVMNGRWKADVLAKFDWAKPAEFKKAVTRSYPFHPSLIDLAEHEWSAHTGFQRVRSTIQIFATTVYAHVRRAEVGQWVPALIGPGDLPLSNPDVVNAVLTSGLLEDDRIVSSYREIAGTEVADTTDTRGTAREKDLARTGSFAHVNPRASERLGTALFLYSVSPRPRGQQGATETELKAATFVPDTDYEPSDADIDAPRELIARTDGHRVGCFRHRDAGTLHPAWGNGEADLHVSDPQFGLGLEEPHDDGVRRGRDEGSRLDGRGSRRPGDRSPVGADPDVADRLAVDEDPLPAERAAQPRLIDDLLAVDDPQRGTVVVVLVLRPEGHRTLGTVGHRSHHPFTGHLDGEFVVGARQPEGHRCDRLADLRHRSEAPRLARDGNEAGVRDGLRHRPGRIVGRQREQRLGARGRRVGVGDLRLVGIRRAAGEIAADDATRRNGTG
ncbi:MAG TPA: DUF499 domain-containing protein [Acidimicrobiia bacterium]|nr:DUF499 domain-containing protein [Acidimicrobiia bacterium]